MNKRLKFLILALLIAIMALSVVACNDSSSEDSGGTTPGGDEPIDDPVIPNKSVVFENIRNGLVNAETEISAMQEGTRNVTSEYTYKAGGVNIGIRYEANYAVGRDVDSEIMLLFHNYNTSEDVMFIYYDAHNLYYSLGGERGRFENFRLNSGFDVFFDAITSLDMQRVLYSEEFAEDIESLSTMAESTKITLVPTEREGAAGTVKGETVTVSDINLDTLRNTVNDFLEDIHSLAGSSVDALTDEFLGFKFSDMTSLQVGQFTATRFMTVNDVVDGNYINRGFDITFEGDQDNDITQLDSYRFDISYTRSDSAGSIDIPDGVNPDNNNDYLDENAGESYMTGILKLPFTETEFTVDFRSYIDLDDNASNLIAFNVYREKGAYDENGSPTTEREKMFGIYMDEGVLYFDFEGLIENYLRSHTVSSDGSVSYGDYLMDFDKLGLPKAKLGDEENPFDLTDTLNSVIRKAMSALSEGIDGLIDGFTSALPDDGETTEEPSEQSIDWVTVFSKIESQKEEYNSGDYRYKDAYVLRVTIDSEFLEAVFGEDLQTMLTDYASELGFDRDIVEKIVSLGLLDDLKLIVEYRHHLGELGLKLMNGDDEKPLFDLKLYMTEATDDELDSDGRLVIETPADTGEIVFYNKLTLPEHYGASFGAEITFTENTDISPFLGIMVGDVTGANTPFELSNSDKLVLRGDVWEYESEIYGDVTISYLSASTGDEKALARLTLGNYDPEYAYVCLTIPGQDEMRYRLTRRVVFDSFTELTGEEFDYDSLIDLVYAVLGAATVTLEGSTLGAKLISTESDTVLNDFFEAEFTADANLSFFFELPYATEAEYVSEFDPVDYPVPSVQILGKDGKPMEENSIVKFHSIYEAQWYNRAQVTIGDKTYEMAISYTEESTTPVAGKTEYRPVSLLMGADVGYIMQLLDKDGGKLVSAMYGDYATYWEIDPTTETPFPDEVPVVYTDGTTGNKSYVIKDDSGKDIAITNENIKQYLDGVPAKYYTVVIGEGSIAETSYRIRLEILPGRLVGYTENADGVPIVASVTIDPLEYGAAVMSDPDYDPLRYDSTGRTSITLRFGGAGSAEREVTVENSELNWDTKELKVTFSAAEWVFYGKYNGTVDIAVAVTVEPKEDPEISITGESLGVYTVDSLRPETYRIPTTTDEANEVRIYFESDHYRIVGNEADYLRIYGALPDSDYFDGFYESELIWSYSVATLTPIDGTTRPLAGGDAGTTVAEFGYEGSIGLKTLTLSVNCPSRDVEYRYGGSAYDVGNRENGAMIHVAAFTAYGDADTETFAYSPYAETVMLPDTVYIEAVYREAGRPRMIGYPVEWEADDGIVTEDGLVTARRGTRTEFVVVGKIGGSDIYDYAPVLELNMLVTNESGEYESVEFRGGTVTVENYTVNGMNPYDLLSYEENGEVFYRLPTEVVLNFAEESGLEQAEYPAEWFFVRATNSGMTEGVHYGAIDSEAASAAGRIYADNFITSPAGGSFVFAMETAEGEGILSQRIEITVSFESVEVVTDHIYGIGNGDKEIDTYAPYSKQLLEKLETAAGNGYADRTEIGFTTAETALSEVDVLWNKEKLDAFIAALKSPFGGTLELAGTVYAGTILEADISQTFIVSDNTITSDLGFINHRTDVSRLVAEEPSEDGTLNYTLTVERIYALTADGAFATPYDYIEYLLSNVEFTIGDTPYSAIAEYSVDGEDFNNRAYQRAGTVYPEGEAPVGGIVAVNFYVTNLYGAGSCVQPMNIRAVFHKSVVPSHATTITESLETYSEDGAPLYGSGYTLPDTFVVTFAYTISSESSNTVEYTVPISGLNWIAQGTFTTDDGEVAIRQGDEVTVIPSSLMDFNGSATIILSTLIPDGFTQLGRQITIRPKMITNDGETYRYNAAATAEKGFTVETGYINIPNIFAVYSLLDDNFKSLLPTVIQPQSHNGFTTDYALINFPLTSEGWTPAEAFADGSGGFDAGKLKSILTSKGYEGLLATGEISGYGGETQTVKLFVRVTRLSSPAIVPVNLTDSGFDSEHRQHLTLDPYGAYSDASGEYALTYTPTISFGGSVEHTFTRGDIVYKDKNGDSIFRINYNAYGNESQDITIVLPDGTSFVVTVDFIDRELGEGSHIEYTTTANAGTQSAVFNDIYYIDPYDTKTYTLPGTATFVFGSDASRLEGYPTGTWTLVEGEEEEGVFLDGKYLGGYHPGTYTFKGNLPERGDTAGSPFTLTVYVLKREYAGAERFEFTFDGNEGRPDPFTALVSDLDVDVKITNTKDDVYEDYYKELTPVEPDVLWKKGGAALTDNDLQIFGGYGYELTGSIGYGVGSERSAVLDVGGSVTAPKISFDAIGRNVDGNFEVGANNLVFEFNPFTFECMESEFTVRFKTTEGVNIDVTFTEEGAIGGDTSGKAGAAVLIWDEQWKKDIQGSAEESQGYYRIILSNRNKKDGGIYSPAINYQYITRQISIDEIDLGYGQAGTGEVELVIDPLNPVIPVEAEAFGRVQGSASGTGELYSVGKVAITWVDNADGTSVYDRPIGGGERTFTINVVTKEGYVEQEDIFNVKVIYLNRIPTVFATTNGNYSTAQMEAGAYPLMKNTGGSREYYFNIDPTNQYLFVSDLSDSNTRYLSEDNKTYIKSKYLLPDSIVVQFANAYSAGSTAGEALEKLGETITLTDIEWLIVRDCDPDTPDRYRDITLAGTDVLGEITAKPRAFRISYRTGTGEEVVTEKFDYFGNDSFLSILYQLVLETPDRQVARTSISEATLTTEGLYYQRAGDEWYIDPYDISFPTEITVYFGFGAGGAGYSRTYTNVEWTWEEEYLEDPSVVTGLEGGQPLPDDSILHRVEAFMEIYGTTLMVSFPVRHRYIEETKIETPEGATTSPMNGGTIYVLQGIPLAEQLPDRLYYEFEYEDGAEIAGVPLQFEASEIERLSTAEAGTVHSGVRGQLGINKGNIVFTIVVVDPKLYSVEETTESGAAVYKDGAFLFDKIPIAVTITGAYLPGPEQDLLPKRIVLDDVGDGAYWDIDSIDFVTQTSAPYAVVNASYGFASSTDNDRLYGDINGSRKLKISFTIPIETYVYTSVQDASAALVDVSYLDGVPYVEVPLGTRLTADLLPKASGMSITPLWDMSDVNHNQAGTYEARYSYVNVYNETLVGVLRIIINRRTVGEEMINITPVVGLDPENFLEHSYAEGALDIEKYIVINETFLRADGSLGLPEGYIVHYSINDGTTWQNEQPINVGEYLVRITVNDYNYEGYLIFEMLITEANVYLEDNIDFVDETGGVEIESSGKWEYVYDGAGHAPVAAGIPEGLQRETLFAAYDPSLSLAGHDFTSAALPRAAGSYVMRVAFNAEQNNYNIVGSETVFYVRIDIRKATIDGDTLTVVSELEYNGTERDAVIEGLPQGVNSVVYVYYDEAGNKLDGKPRNVGNYGVDITINGGNNYTDYSISDATFSIVARKIIISIGRIRSEYLSEILPYDSELSILYAGDESLPGLVGDELNMVNAPDGAPAGYVGTAFSSIFPGMEIKPLDESGSPIELNSLYMIGEYPLGMVGNWINTNYEYELRQVDGSRSGVYEIAAVLAGSAVVRNKGELETYLTRLHQGTLTTGSTARLYLMPGEYGTITVNGSVNVSIIGSYEFDENGEPQIAVSFEKITVESGTALLDILSFTAKEGADSVYVGKNASVTISRSEFFNGSSGKLPNSTAIRVVDGRTGTLLVSSIEVRGYGTAIQVDSGNIQISDSSITNCVSGIISLKGSVSVSDTKFISNILALSIGMSEDTPVISGAEFANNNVAIETRVPLRKDYDAQNIFLRNVTDVIENF